MICCKTVIGKGSPNMAGTAAAHGAIVNPDEIALIRKELRWTEEPFQIPEEVYLTWDAKESGHTKEEAWKEILENYSLENQDLSHDLQRMISGDLPDGVENAILSFVKETQEELPKMATRVSSQKVLNVLGPLVPELLGGSADLTGSNNTNWDGTKALTSEDCSGNYINY